MTPDQILSWASDLPHRKVKDVADTMRRAAHPPTPRKGSARRGK